MKILIAGAGPVGLCCAHLLGHAGIESVLIEKQVKLGTHPSAHYIHSRSMEILRDIGISQQIYENMPNKENWRKFIYCKNILGEVYRSHDHFSTAAYQLNNKLSDMHTAHFPQHKLLSLLANSLPETASLSLGKEFSELSQGASGVKVKTADGEEFEGDYLIACDGASSKVRNFLGIRLEGTGILQHFLNIHFISKELGSLAKNNPAMIYFVYNPENVCVMVMHNADEGEFIMQYPFYPEHQHLSNFTDADYKEIISSVAGSSINDVEIKSIKPWRLASRLANEFSKDRVFLAGDSAHQMTPAGGFGLNSGIKDAHCLCWRFQYPELLKFYSQERHQFLEEILKTSLGYYYKAVNIAKNFRLDLDNMKIFQDFTSYLPFGNEWIFNQGMKWGQKAMFNDANARYYLSDDKNLIDNVHPKEDLELAYTSGYFENGGELAPNVEILYENKKIPLRALPAVLMKKNKKPVFIKLEGKNPLPTIPYETFTMPSHSSTSYLIRPDGHLYSSK
ncbi:unnamed protein product [Blepharisma stoltei]|uniref:FAD-binding domain-containing protein n=1 Tax=Blepharisma stoltei TaxID=1481888 RepID=A0AAU9ILT6_9CILI|nr:unnamed protein product [Blepharisma stoltei]